MKIGLALCASTVLALAAGSAQAAFFSFASDTNQNGPTFRNTGANGSTLNDGGTLNTNGSVNGPLLADLDEDGPNAPISINARFTFNGSLSNYQAISLSSGFLHTFRVNGTFSFLDAATSGNVMTATFANAVFASYSNTASTLGRTASIQANAGTDPTLAFSFGGALGTESLPEDENFVFTLTSLRNSSGGFVTVTPNGTLGDLRSEGSFSAAAIPAPGAVALLGLGGLIVARRRRA